MLVSIGLTSGCQKNTWQLHSRSASGVNYSGIWRSNGTDHTSLEVAHLLVFDLSSQNNYMTPSGRSWAIPGRRPDPTGIAICPEGIFLYGKRLEGASGERVFVWTKSKVIPVSLSTLELDELSRNKIERIETTEVWKKIMDMARAETATE
jgi:hypothetical protein